MKGGHQPHGFTIIEALIFLAVSGFLLISAMTLINGKQNTTEFSQGIRQIENDLQKVINQVASGYYLNGGGFSCQENGLGAGNTIAINSSSMSQGSNFGCQFIGEAIQFGPSANPDEYVIYPLAGAEYADTALTPITKIASADITPLSPGFSPVDETQTVQLPFNIDVATIGGSATGQPGVIVLTTLSPPVTVTSQQPSTINGGTNENLVGLVGTTLNMDQHSTEVAIKDMCTSGHNACTYNQPVSLCFNSTTTNQSGVITIGSATNPTSVSLSMQGHNCP